MKVCVCMCEWRRPAQAADFAWYDKRIFTLLFKQYIIDYNIVLYFRYALLLKRSPWRVAKKFLSTSYRKTQRDWFGKKGLPWPLKDISEIRPDAKKYLSVFLRYNSRLKQTKSL